MSKPPTKARLVDAAVFNRIDDLLKPHERGLRAFLRSFVGDDDEDLFEDFLVRVYRNWDKLGHENHQAWFYRVARNMALDHLRTKRRRGPHLPFDEELDSPSGPHAASDESTLDSLITGEDLGRVRDAVDHLPEQLREVTILSDFLQWDRKRVADLLDVTVQVVSNRKHAAHKRLAELLSDLAPKPRT